MQTTKVRRFYGFQIEEGEEKIYIATKPKVKCFPDEMPQYVFMGYITSNECNKTLEDFPKKGNIYSTIGGVRFVCVDFWLTTCNE